MSKTIVLLGTRKGAFLLESDEARQDWQVRGPFCESWPVNHVIQVPETGALHAAAASEWFGTAVWTSTDLGATWAQSSQGLTYGDGPLKLSKVSGLSARDGRLFAGAENPGIFQSRDGGQTWSLLSTISGHPDRDAWNDPANQPPGHLGVPAIHQRPGDPSHWMAIVQGIGIFETTDDGATFTPRNAGMRADWPREHDDIGLCVHSLSPSPADPDRLFAQTHVGTYRSDDAGLTWTEITAGLPTDFGFASAPHPYDRDSFFTTVLDGGHGRTMPEGKAAVWRTRDAGATWERLSNGLPQQNAFLGVLREGLATDAHEAFGLYMGTSTGQVFASIDEGETWREIASYLPPITSVETAVVDG
jgi:photosystem II stability/assembly factor-like uncharacterized protein